MRVACEAQKQENVGMMDWRGNSLYLLIFTVWSSKENRGVQGRCVKSFSQEENVLSRPIYNALGGSELIIQVLATSSSSVWELVRYTESQAYSLNQECEFLTKPPVTWMHVKVWEVLIQSSTLHRYFELLSFSPFPPTTYLPNRPHSKIAEI